MFAAAGGVYYTRFARAKTQERSCKSYETSAHEPANERCHEDINGNVSIKGAAVSSFK